MPWSAPSTINSDNLGNHTASQDLDLNSKSILNGDKVEASKLVRSGTKEIDLLPFAFGSVNEDGSILEKISSENFSISHDDDGEYIIKLFDYSGDQLTFSNDEKISLVCTANDKNPHIITYYVSTNEITIRASYIKPSEIELSDTDFSFRLWFAQD